MHLCTDMLCASMQESRSPILATHGSVAFPPRSALSANAALPTRLVAKLVVTQQAETQTLEPPTMLPTATRPQTQHAGTGTDASAWHPETWGAARAFLSVVPLQAQVPWLKSVERAISCTPHVMEPTLASTSVQECTAEGAADVRSMAEPGRDDDRRQAEAQTTDAGTANTGCQTEAPDSPARHDGTSQCPDASDKQFSHVDVGTTIDTRMTAHKATETDVAAGRVEPGVVSRADAAVGGACLAQEPAADHAAVARVTADIGNLKLMQPLKSVDAADQPPVTTSTKTADAVSAGAQTEQLTAVNTAGAATGTVLAMIVRQLLAGSRPDQLEQPRIRHATAQTHVAQAMLHDDDPGAAQVAANPIVTPAQPGQASVADDSRAPEDCLQIPCSPAPVAATAVEQLNIPCMEAATQPRPDAASAQREGSICSEGQPAAGYASPVPSVTAAVPADEPDLSIPGTPRRHIHRRLWRSGRTSEWADLFSNPGDHGLGPESSPRMSSSGDGASSVSASSSSELSSDSVATSLSSGGSGAPSALVLRTAACQTSDAAVSTDTPEDSDSRASSSRCSDG